MDHPSFTLGIEEEYLLVDKASRDLVREAPDALPRTGLPPEFSSFAEYERSTAMLMQTGAIEDRSKLWWDLRPSTRYPHWKCVFVMFAPAWMMPLPLPVFMFACVVCCIDCGATTSAGVITRVF